MPIGVYDRNKFHGRRISEGLKGKKHSDEHKRKISVGLDIYYSSHKVSKEARLKIGKAHKGMKHSEESKRKMSESSKGRISPMKGKHHTKETKVKIGLASKGRKVTPTQLKGLELGHGWNKGKSSSEKTRLKISESLRGKPSRRGHGPMPKGYWLKVDEHRQAIEEEAKSLKEKGYQVLNVNEIRPDLIARKDNYLYAVEVEFGDPNTDKYIGQNLFDDIWWIIRKHKVV